ncbi:hypothetical protein ACH5RR_025935 [Cinchona calisaya]|uniref:Integrase catalytic domain-containing protein n=1 Tax=Cinchona calisaya TaxID=153742 RepID=A0ABD2Z279_9GENT
MVPIQSLWKFAQREIDILGPFPKEIGKVEFLIVTIDYFTKWIEAKLLASISEKVMKKFFWKNIICRFGIPSIFITDNRKYLEGEPFKSFYYNLGIKQHFISVAHSQMNE